MLETYQSFLSKWCISTIWWRCSSIKNLSIEWAPGSIGPWGIKKQEMKRNDCLNFHFQWFMHAYISSVTWLQIDKFVILIKPKICFLVPQDNLCSQTYEKQREALDTDSCHDEVEAKLLASYAARPHTKCYQMPSKDEVCVFLPNCPAAISVFVPRGSPSTAKERYIKHQLQWKSLQIITLEEIWTFQKWKFLTNTLQYNVRLQVIILKVSIQE